MSVTVVYRSAADLNRAEYWYEEGPKLQIEVEKLRKVVEAAREFFESNRCEPKECNKCDPKYINFCERSGIGQALAELDKEGD